MQIRFTGVYASQSDMARMRQLVEKELERKRMEADGIAIVDIPPQPMALDFVNECALAAGLAPLPDGICYGITQAREFVAPADVYPDSS